MADFGYSVLTREEYNTTTAGTMQIYMPPEILHSKNRPYDAIKADIYTCGIVLFIMMTKKVLFRINDAKYDSWYKYYRWDKNKFWIAFKKLNKELELDDEFLELIDGMLVEDP